MTTEVKYDESKDRRQYLMVWGNQYGFNIWESVDEQSIQLTGPDGEVIWQKEMEGLEDLST